MLGLCHCNDIPHQSFIEKRDLFISQFWSAWHRLWWESSWNMSQRWYSSASLSPLSLSLWRHSDPGTEFYSHDLVGSLASGPPLNTQSDWVSNLLLTHHTGFNSYDSWAYVIVCVLCRYNKAHKSGYSLKKRSWFSSCSKDPRAWHWCLLALVKSW